MKNRETLFQNIYIFQGKYNIAFIYISKFSKKKLIKFVTEERHLEA